MFNLGYFSSPTVSDNRMRNLEWRASLVVGHADLMLRSNVTVGVGTMTLNGKLF